MPAPAKHFAKNLLFACIDDRLVEHHLNFIIQIGGAFYPAVAGGGLAFVDPNEQETALKQVAAAYAINKINTVYLESHTDCGAYRLAGVTFTNRDEEVARLFADLDQAESLVRARLAAAGALAGEVAIKSRVVDPSGTVVDRPVHAVQK